MKWNHNGIAYRRGCYEALIAQYDGKGPWYSTGDSIMTQQTMKSYFKLLGKHLNAKSVEVKPLYDEDDNATVSEIRVFTRYYSGAYRFHDETLKE